MLFSIHMCQYFMKAHRQTFQNIVLAKGHSSMLQFYVSFIYDTYLGINHTIQGYNLQY